MAVFLLASCAAYGAELQSERSGQSSRPTGAPPNGSEAQPAGRITTPILVSPEEDYRIGPNDLIDIRVDGAPELTQTYQVTATGTFLMPWIGRVTALKKTTEELAQSLADNLRGDYCKDPKANALVREYNSRSFFIQGAVRNPGVYQIDGPASLLKLIILAGGLVDNHGSTAFIIREIRPAADKANANASAPSAARESARARNRGRCRSCP